MDTDQQDVIKLLCHFRFINMAPQEAILDKVNANKMTFCSNMIHRREFFCIYILYQNLIAFYTSRICQPQQYPKQNILEGKSSVMQQDGITFFVTKLFFNKPVKGYCLFDDMQCRPSISLGSAIFTVQKCNLEILS